jgi:hypothetical protein
MSSSDQYNEDMVNIVSNITPAIGFTNKIPPSGGEFVVIVTLLDEETPLSRTQDRVKINEDCGGRLFPTIAKLTKCEETTEEAERVRESGDKETKDKATVASSTDHFTTPRDFRLTVPKIFNFEDGFILYPEITSNLNTGDKESRIDNSITFWQLLTLPLGVGVDDMPFMTILKREATGGGKDELTVTLMTEEVDVRGVKMMEPHWAPEAVSETQLDWNIKEEDRVLEFES